MADNALSTHIATDMPNAKTGTTPQGQRFDVAQNASSVLVKSNSDMSDSMEELSVSIAEKMEEKLKEIHAGRKASVMLASVSQVQDFMEHMRKSTSMQQLEALAKRVLSQGGSPGQMLKMVKEQFKEDSASQYMALQFIASYAKDSGASADKQEMLQEAINILEEDHGDAIFAVVNAAEAGHAYGANEAQVQQFVTGYKEVVLDKNSLSDILGTVLSLITPKEEASTQEAAPTEKQYQGVIDHLIKAVGNDINALRPSRDPEKLHVVLKDLQLLHVLNSVLDNCRIAAQGVKKYAEAM